MAIIHIPSDVIQDILSRLSVKDLLRFRCVSKFFFKSLIDSPDLIKLHLSHSPKTSYTNLYSIYNCGEITNPKFMLLDLNNKCGNHIPKVVLNPPPKQDGTSYSVCRVLGACNGLVAINDGYFGKQIILWNPFTGKSKKVVPSPRQDDGARLTYGFGYDPNADDFKLVELSVSRAFIFSLKTNSWKEIDEGCSLNYKNYTWLGDGVLANNVLHWLVKDGNKNEKIISFDFVKEKFHHGPVLEFLEYFDRMKLSVLDGCLTVAAEGFFSTHVWTMRDYSVKQSWTKLFSCLEPCSKSVRHDRRCPIIPLTYSESRDKVLLLRCCHVVWYDLVNKRVKSYLSGNNFPRGEYNVKMFKGSLVALEDNANEINAKRKHIILKHDEEKKEEKRRKGK